MLVIDYNFTNCWALTAFWLYWGVCVCVGVWILLERLIASKFVKLMKQFNENEKKNPHHFNEWFTSQTISPFGNIRILIFDIHVGSWYSQVCILFLSWLKHIEHVWIAIQYWPTIKWLLAIVNNSTPAWCFTSLTLIQNDFNGEKNWDFPLLFEKLGIFGE